MDLHVYLVHIYIFSLLLHGLTRTCEIEIKSENAELFDKMKICFVLNFVLFADIKVIP